MKLTSNSSKRAGYTVTEIMIAVSIFSLFSIGLTAFFISSLGLYSVNIGRIQNNAGMRRFSERFADDVRTASVIDVYSSFNNRTADMSGIGDLLVLTYQNSLNQATRIVYYYRDTNTTGAYGGNPVRRGEVIASNPTLPAASTQGTHPVALNEMLLKTNQTGVFARHGGTTTAVFEGDVINRGSVRANLKASISLAFSRL
jgi:type II secretory pathway component PulJ